MSHVVGPSLADWAVTNMKDILTPVLEHADSPGNRCHPPVGMKPGLMPKSDRPLIT